MTSLVLSLNKFSYFGPMIVVVLKYLTRFGIRGLTLYPFVFVSDSFAANDVVLINHERIHLRQQLELLVIPFYICICLLLLSAESNLETGTILTATFVLKKKRIQTKTTLII